MFERYVAVQFYEPEDAPGNFELCSHLDFGHPTVESITLKRFKSVEKDGAIYRVLQTLEPKIDTPSLPDPGYLLFAFKTMEDMSTNFFLNQWKTWTGARLFRSALEPHIPVSHSVKIVSDGVDLGDECRLVDLNLQIFDENGNGNEPPEPAPNLFLKITEATQTEEDKIRDEGTQTEKFVKIDRQISPMTESRRNSFCSLPRSPAIQDLAGLFGDGLQKPNESPEAVKNEALVLQTWDRLSAELDGYLQRMLRESRPKASPPPMRCASEDSEQFFRKLREKYFRSPDFPREERHRTVVLVNDT
ncbi:unnamed protein product, partial [Mesorhabditis spiculigera]